ncbi:DUF4147 domain-containing protein [Thalassospira sp. NFXS8]|uniref:glycerate kinase type-2 family protein n=1 Tax=Thalassospira sp. NFXS8 TaxID=2819093 RepID=UPI0032DF8A9A
MNTTDQGTLGSQGIAELREHAKDMFAAAVKRADPEEGVRRQLAVSPLPSKKGGRCIVLAIGKAAIPMMRAAQSAIPDVHDALVVTNPENMCDLVGTTVIAGMHPVPDAASAHAGRCVIDFLQASREGDVVVALISGGGSSLMIAPAGGISVEDYGSLNDVLLASGLAINDMNLIRQQVDDLKGGGLLRFAAPAEVHALLLSDVIGDDLRAIASGPTVAPIGTPQQAVSLMKSLGIWDKVPASIRDHLVKSAPIIDLPTASNHLIGSNRQSLEAMLAAAPKGFDAHIVSDALVGDVERAATEVIAAARSAKGPVALIFGGETTVQIKGSGRGGRNQELALRFALAAKDTLQDNWVFLSGGTDGRDGPTDAAGALVDEGTLKRIADAGGNLDALLRNNDSHEALSRAHDLLVTGATGTNVADVQVLLLP